MRIHGDKKIKRRSNVKQKKDYHNYKKPLREDFKDICGYCGKNAEVLKEDFQLDHFVPKKLDKNRENDYYNLVYSCRICNRQKWDNWPTKDISKPNDGRVGFVDPATEDFDKNLHRDENGNIIADTEVGNYMYKIFKFDIRPISTIWLAMELNRKQCELAEKINNNKNKEDINEYKEYFEVSQAVDKLINFLYNRR